MLHGVKVMGAIAALTLCFSTAKAANYEFTAGDVGGVWYTTAAGLSQLVQAAHPDVVLKTVPGGGVTNPAKLQAGASQFGLVQSIFATAAVKGATPFDGKPNPKIRLVLQGLAKNYVHYVQTKGETRSIADALKQPKLRIALPRAGSTDEYTFRFIMKHYGTSYDAIRANGGKVVNADYNDIVSAFKDDQVDAFFVLLGIPGAAIIDASQGRAAALGALPAELVEHLSSTYGYTKAAVPAATYPGLQARDAATVVTSTSLYTSSDVPNEVVYKVAAAICKDASKLPDVHKSMMGFACNAEAMGDGSVPLHPGAKDYFAKAGVR
ncbi:MAG: TAXI family TRAP transporter solute-binding subunit [Ferrovibrio sp.]|uniref:TAXI family TRAP transporter solute-binding subunit n=1 Tax=Ferrovibrio sp. TaxID=1917215 RepID=UPI0026388BFF|nr:TAXI family TRAP transporter solute-binding subunit [Ferrovibrio sp.]MCW0234280.1 TAXI family TRAP transporter solute-binding subunit [Ferrovibrio sp.]